MCKISVGGRAPAPPQPVDDNSYNITYKFECIAISYHKDCDSRESDEMHMTKKDPGSTALQNRLTTPTPNEKNRKELVSPFAIRTLLKCIQCYYSRRARGPFSLSEAVLSPPSCSLRPPPALFFTFVVEKPFHAGLVRHGGFPWGNEWFICR